VNQPDAELARDSSGPSGTDQPGGPAAPPRLRPAYRYGPGFRALTLVTLAVAYLLIVLGDTVRVTESGMGCASWPLCNGSIGLVGTYHAMLEQSHRYVAAVLSILVAAAFAAAWRRARRDRLVFGGATAALALIGVQVLLGALTVFTRNVGWTVALHLAGAWLVVAAVTVTAVASWRAESAPDRPGPLARAIPSGRFGAAAPVALFVLSVSGMLVLHEGASNACPGWPLCPGGPSAPGGLVALQYLHRSLVLVATVVIVAAAMATWRARRAPGPDKALAAAALVLLAATAAMGGVVATTGAPAWAQDLHLAIASGLWITVVAMAVPARRSPEQAADREAAVVATEPALA
jgi:cytochrome c oxidase assembly protein subunit 15